MDRGFLFGDSIYELIPVYGRKPFLLDAHLARLDHSADGVRMRLPYDRTTWAAHIADLIEAQPWPDQFVYLQVSRGAAATRDHRLPQGLAPTVFMFAQPFSSQGEEVERTGVRAITAPDNRWLRCDLKINSLLPNVLLRDLATRAGASECLLFRDGQLTEGSSANVVLVQKGRLRVPRFDHLVLHGITVGCILDLARERGLVTDIGPIDREQLLAADEVWICSSGREIVAVVEIDGQQIGTGQPGPVWAAMLGWYRARARATAPFEPACDTCLQERA